MKQISYFTISQLIYLFKDTWAHKTKAQNNNKMRRHYVKQSTNQGTIYTKHLITVSKVHHF